MRAISGAKGTAVTNIVRNPVEKSDSRSDVNKQISSFCFLLWRINQWYHYLNNQTAYIFRAELPKVTSNYFKMSVNCLPICIISSTYSEYISGGLLNSKSLMNCLRGSAESMKRLSLALRTHLLGAIQHHAARRRD